MHAVILSAGQGSRLAPLTAHRPKCLIEFSKVSLLEWQLAALAEAGIDEVTVVTGFEAAQVRDLLARRHWPHVATLHNPFFRVADNISSVWLARDALLGGDALILNGDTLVGPALIAAAVAAAVAPVNVTTATKASYDDDDMKVTLAHGRVTAVSKRLPPGETDAESIGMLIFRGTGGARFADAIDLAIGRDGGTGNYYLSAVSEMAQLGFVGAADVTGHPSAEVDYPEDLIRARALTASWRGQRWAQRGTVLPFARAAHN